MESKKINQLATELTPALSDLTIIGDPSTGISKKITLSQMASLFTGTVEEYANLASFPLVGVADTIYIALDTNVLYRWNTGTNAYVELSPNIINSLVFSDANGFDGTISLVGSVATLTITTALTQGSVAFIGASGALSQDNANYFWDNTNKRLGINTNTPTTAIDAFGSGIIGRLNGTSTNNAFLGFASAGTNKWSIGNVQSDHRFRIYSEANTAELVSVLQTGEVGIGIANPLTKLHIDGDASALIANLDANVSVAKSISFRSDNSARINLEVSGTESGSNAGMNFYLRAYTDAGALLSTPLTITRSTGNVALTGEVSIAMGSDTSYGKLNIKSNNTLTYGGINVFANANDRFISLAHTGTIGVIEVNNAGSAVMTPLTIRVAGDERIRINTSGLVGIGTTSPSYTLDVHSNNSTFTSRIINLNTTTDSAGLLIQAGVNAGNEIAIFKNAAGTSRVGIYANGYVGIGTTSPSDILDVQRNQNGTTFFNFRNTDTTNSNSRSYMQVISGNVTLQIKAIHGDNVYITPTTAVNQYLGYNNSVIINSAGTLTANGVSIGASDVRSSSNVLTLGGTSEAMRIISTGFVGIGTTNPTRPLMVESANGGTTRIHNTRNLNGDVIATWELGGVNTANTSSYYLYCDTDSVGVRMVIYGNGNLANVNNSYGAYSDIKLKENITDATPKLNDLLKVKVRNYNLISDESKTKQIGVIAQELEEIFPALIEESNDTIKDENGENIETGEKTKSVKYSVFVPMLIKAIQELNAKIESK